ncbi:hypothetical protein ACHAXS_003278 [Conticribra weissflogii]
MASTRPISPPPFRSTVRILHGSSLFPQSAPPPPPPSPPPKPSHLCKLAVVGDALSGKSLVVQKFINRSSTKNRSFTQSHPNEVFHRLHPCVGSGNSNDKNDNFNNNHNNGEGDASCCTEGASSTTTSIGTSIGTSVAAIEPTVAEYYKKDVTLFWSSNRQNTFRGKRCCEKKMSRIRSSHIAHANAEGRNIRRNKVLNNTSLEESDECVCVRVQVWDMNIQHYLNINNNPNSSAIDSSLPTSGSLHNSLTFQPRQSNSLIAALLPLFKRVHGILIVCKFPCPPCSEYFPSEEWENIAWPEIDELERCIRKWANFIRGNIVFPSQCNNTPILYSVLLNHPGTLIIDNAIKLSARHNISDKLVYSLQEWSHLKNRMKAICEKNGIDLWSIGASYHGNSAECIHECRGCITRDSENTFIDMISLYLDRLTKSN